ncbi:MAG: hypothetical protein LBL51_02660 [Synergistaceae bacterium]|jgi:uncharacterized protein YgbK (DUF1537 family)|nr:hypothetical protein [Synergistaceae bacterium]
MEYVIVADNYTGAVETASKFMNGGYRSAVTLDPGSLGLMRDCAAVALDTETFFSSPQDAAKKLTNVARTLRPWKDSAVFFKRVEPALRGNAGPEVRALIDTMGFDCAVVVPAFSRGRRAIEEGTIYLDSQESPPLLAQLPKPASAETAAEILRLEGLQPAVVSLEALQAGTIDEIVAAKGCFCFDAESDDDLKAIVRGVLKTTPAKNVLWVGSVGLAEALALTPRPYVFVVGTTHPRSIRQARQLLDQALAYPVQVDAGALKSGEEAAGIERARAAETAETLLRCGQSILLAATLNGRFVRGSYPDDDQNSFLGFIADTVREIIGRARIGGLCVTGGDCAVRIVRKARAESLALIEEIQEGITFSRFFGGPFDGLPVITKSGALGGERALLHCREHFQQIHAAV